MAMRAWRVWGISAVLGTALTGAAKPPDVPVKVEVDGALRDSGLHLEGEKRAQFEQRYLQERRRIEYALRQETEAKRQEQLPALRERLKKEFQEPSPSVTSTSAPAASGSPKK